MRRSCRPPPTIASIKRRSRRPLIGAVGRVMRATLSLRALHLADGLAVCRSIGAAICQQDRLASTAPPVLRRSRRAPAKPVQQGPEPTRPPHVTQQRGLARVRSCPAPPPRPSKSRCRRSRHAQARSSQRILTHSGKHARRPRLPGQCRQTLRSPPAPSSLRDGSGSCSWLAKHFGPHRCSAPDRLPVRHVHLHHWHREIWAQHHFVRQPQSRHWS